MRRSVYFAAQRLIGSNVAKYYREFLELEAFSREELRDLQQFRVAQTLRHATENIPFYKSLETADSRELSSFPILTKDMIADNFDRLISHRLLHERKQHTLWHYGSTLVKTGGSTGRPTCVIHTAEYRDRGRASRLFSQYLCGFPLATAYFKLWGSMRDISQSRDSVSRRTLNWLSNERLLNAFQMSQDDIQSYLKLIEESTTNHMMAYTDAAYELARSCQAASLKVRSLRSVMACAGTVTDEVRSCIEAVFRGRVHNKYGSRECADIACECDHGGLHIYNNNVHVEVVGEDGLPVPIGQSGRILITLLGNFDFPLIRYEIGDIGALTDRPCECGRPFPLLQKLEGRSVEFLRAKSGAYVSPVFIRHLIGVVHNPGVLRRFQLIQDTPTDFTLQFEAEHNAQSAVLSDCLAEIEQDLKKVLGMDSSINCRQVEQIAPLASGKFLYTYSNVSRLNHK